MYIWWKPKAGLILTLVKIWIEQLNLTNLTKKFQNWPPLQFQIITSSWSINEHFQSTVARHLSLIIWTSVHPNKFGINYRTKAGLPRNHETVHILQNIWFKKSIKKSSMMNDWVRRIDLPEFTNCTYRMTQIKSYNWKNDFWAYILNLIGLRILAFPSWC